MRKEEMIDFVRRTMPELTIATSEVKTNGWDNDILIINKQQVFRFPRTKQTMKRIKDECDLLRRLSLNPPLLQTPRYKEIYEGEALKAVTYPFLIGEPLIEDPVDLSENPENARLLGDFLMRLHQIQGCSLPTRHTFRYWQSLFELLKKKVFMFLNAREQKAIEEVFTHFLNGYLAFSFKMMPIHGDLSASNILFDRAENRVSGIIDFTDAQMGDPAFDFAGIYWNYGVTYTRKVLSYYHSKESSDELFKRVSNFYGLQPLFHELLYSVNHDEPIDRVQIKRFMELKRLIF